jgi:hypothetical protein
MDNEITKIQNIITEIVGLRKRLAGLGYVSTDDLKRINELLDRNLAANSLASENVRYTSEIDK